MGQRPGLCSDITAPIALQCYVCPRRKLLWLAYLGGILARGEFKSRKRFTVQAEQAKHMSQQPENARDLCTIQ